MNIRETRNGGLALSIEAELSNEYKKEAFNDIRRREITPILLFSLAAAAILLVLHIGLSAILLAGVAIRVWYFYEVSRKTVSLQFYLIGDQLRLNIINNKSMAIDVVHYMDDIEQLFISPLKNNKIKVSILGKDGFEKELIILEKERMSEAFELVEKVHKYFSIQPTGVIGEINFERNDLAEPKRKRQYFKIFDQDVEDIRNKGVIQLQGKDFFIERSAQIDWVNGMNSYWFKIDQEQYLYFHASLSSQIFILEKSISYLYDLDFYYLESDLSNIHTSFVYNDITYYQCEQNHGEYYIEGKLRDNNVYQVLYEDEEREHFLRFMIVNGRIETFIGRNIQNHQLQQILPEIED
ncbi:hypothetical protein [Flammeovirga agarivorans]|uniref:Uncharacterized protein n=1 Tax=Flammeovirga agarivorans TaxID=2726742 RepID=A0A7X8SMX2_9BACT|nr:hypothetical protein [Flammeovirga agarivorans]NLR93156.1 hypothetical protein [Flammeovirga agarivorans]